MPEKIVVSMAVWLAQADWGWPTRCNTQSPCRQQNWDSVILKSSKTLLIRQELWCFRHKWLDRVAARYPNSSRSFFVFYYMFWWFFKVSQFVTFPVTPLFWVTHHDALPFEFPICKCFLLVLARKPVALKRFETLQKLRKIQSTFHEKVIEIPPNENARQQVFWTPRKTGFENALFLLFRSDATTISFLVNTVAATSRHCFRSPNWQLTKKTFGRGYHTSHPSFGLLRYISINSSSII